MSSTSVTCGSSYSDDGSIKSIEIGAKCSRRSRDEVDNKAERSSPPAKKAKQSTDEKIRMIPSNFSIDCCIEVYPFGHTKRSYFRDTAILLTDVMDSRFTSIQQTIRSKYGILKDASRCQIGDFKLDLGIKSHNDSKVYTAESETEWENLLGKVKNSLSNYSFVGNHL